MKKLFLSLFLLIVMTPLAMAQDPFIVSGVEVDATGDDAIEAQTNALSEGQLRAANILISRVTLPADRQKAGFGSLTREESARIMRGLEIANERRSANRYLGEITVTFDPAAVEALMASKGIPVVKTSARQRLVLPVLSGQSLWSRNAWSSAWAAPSLQNTLTPFINPSPSAVNAGAINAADAASLNKDALKRAASLYGVNQVTVAVAEPSGGSYKITLHNVSVDTGEVKNLGEFYADGLNAAAIQAVTRMENDWKELSISRVAQAQSIQVSVLYRGHTEWLMMQDQISQSSLITSAQLDALSKDGALMTLKVAGDLEGLARELSYRGLSLKREKGLGLIITRAGR